MGYFSLKELQEVNGPMGLPIERVLYYQPKSLKELLDWQKNREGSNAETRNNFRALIVGL